MDKPAPVDALPPVGAPVVPWLTLQPASALVAWAGLSGLAIVIERVSERAPPPAAWHEEPPP